MKKKELDELSKRCGRIFGFFDVLNDINNSPYETGSLGDLPISNFIDICGKIDPALPKAMTGEAEKKIMKAIYNIQDLAFSLGFVFGQLCELTYPCAQGDVEAVKKAIQKKGLLPYLPRERGGSHGKNQRD